MGKCGRRWPLHPLMSVHGGRCDAAPGGSTGRTARDPCGRVPGRGPSRVPAGCRLRGVPMRWSYPVRQHGMAAPGARPPRQPWSACGRKGQEGFGAPADWPTARVRPPGAGVADGARAWAMPRWTPGPVERVVPPPGRPQGHGGPAATAGGSCTPARRPDTFCRAARCRSRRRPKPPCGPHACVRVGSSPPSTWRKREPRARSRHGSRQPARPRSSSTRSAAPGKARRAFARMLPAVPGPSPSDADGPGGSPPGADGARRREGHRTTVPQEQETLVRVAPEDGRPKRSDGPSCLAPRGGVPERTGSGSRAGLPPPAHGPTPGAGLSPVRAGPAHPTEGRRPGGSRPSVRHCRPRPPGSRETLVGR